MDSVAFAFGPEILGHCFLTAPLHSCLSCSLKPASLSTAGSVCVRHQERTVDNGDLAGRGGGARGRPGCRAHRALLGSPQRQGIQPGWAPAQQGAQLHFLRPNLCNHLQPVSVQRPSAATSLNQASRMRAADPTACAQFAWSAPGFPQLSAAHQCSSARRLGASGRGLGSIGGRLGCIGGRLGYVGRRLGRRWWALGWHWWRPRLAAPGAGACGSPRARADWGARSGAPRGARAGACGNARAGAAGGPKTWGCQRRQEWGFPGAPGLGLPDVTAGEPAQNGSPLQANPPSSGCIWQKQVKRPGLRAAELSAAGMQPPLTDSLACRGLAPQLPYVGPYKMTS